MSFIAPIAHVAQIDLEDANDMLVSWGHRMGACKRPNGDVWAHGLHEHGRLVGVAITAALVAPTCAGLTRAEAVELARLCAARTDLCRVMLRIWREFVFPPLGARYGYEWAVSYQDEALHNGDTYRFDGWLALARSRSGTDQRSGRKGRSKTIWGWHPDPAVRAARRAIVAASAAV